MDLKDKLRSLCLQTMKDLDLLDDKYVQRLKHELLEVDVQDKYSYFIDHYEKKTRWVDNENNLLIPYLLGLCPAGDIGAEPLSVMGEYPDIDVDYIEPVRDHLRNKWAPKVFGSENVAFICTYQTYNMKGALLDMARVFGLDKNEIQNITKNFSVKDEDGDALTWDVAEKMYPAFRDWIAANSEAADAAKRLYGRNRNMSQHAGGFIISDRPLEGFVPMVRNKKDGSMMTAWTEGQNSQDLMEVGLVKMDTLGSKMQEQVVNCVGLILERYGYDGICAEKGKPNWSDNSYLNDPAVIKAANDGDLRFIFQFDSDGIRKLVRQGGVTRFQDLEAYSALYRPGPLNSGMSEAYCRRKVGDESYDAHPVLEPYLGDTYGVLSYQEQIMQMLNVVGKIPLRDGYDVVKAISKKKVEKFKKYKDEFIANAQVTLEISESEATEMWANIQEFASYAFNKSHSCAYTHQSVRQLYLKCHYPLEYFCTRLNHIQDDILLRDCVRQAESHNVRVNPIDINKSNCEFSIYSPGKPSKDDEIYMGFSNIKFVGHEVGDRIVKLREEKPFANYQDFLERFGTEAKVSQALISLGAFNDADNITLWKYYEFCKARIRRIADRSKRFKVAMASYVEQLKNLGGCDYSLSEEGIDLVMEQTDDEAVLAKLRRLKGNYRRSVTGFERKSAEDSVVPSLAYFDPTSVSLAKTNQNILDTLYDREKAELQFYGFIWTHPLDKCPDAMGLTFERYKSLNLTKDDTGRVEGLVVENKEKTSQKGNVYRMIKLLDRNWEPGFINVWMEEYERFKPYLEVGNLVCMELTPPNPKFSVQRYALKGYHAYQRHLAPPIQSDVRVVLLKGAEQDEPPVVMDGNESAVTIDMMKKVNANLRRDDGPRHYEQEVESYFRQGGL